MKNFTKRLIRSATVALFLVLSSSLLFAQRAEIGLRFMPTFSALDVQTSEGGNLKGEVTLGYGIGGIIGFSLSDMFAIQGEIIYSTITQKYSELDIERKITLKYVNIPLLFAFNTGKMRTLNFNIVAGPQIGLSVGSELLTTNDGIVDTNDPILAVKKGDLGFAYGAGFDVALNPAATLRLGIGYRGVYGLIDISDNNNSSSSQAYYVLDKTKIRTNAIYVGGSFLF
jgi:Outer membrane protein beta-barrel domain